MKVLVLGGGVIGVTTAYFLAEAGHEVTVIDRQQGPALETSFANAGEVSPGYASPWAGPGIPVKAVKWLLMKYGPLVVRPAFDPHMWTWLLKMLRNCTAERYALNKSRMVPVAEYSRDTLKALRAATGITYDERSKGTLQLFRKQKQLDGIGGDVEVLKKYGVPYEVLDRDGCIAAEPALAGVREKFVGGLRLPGDETGDCKMFTERLAELCVARGVAFEYGTTVRRVVRNRNRVVQVGTDKGWRTADAYVMALGSYSAPFMRKMKRPIPVYPVKGYSITVPITDAAAAPVSTIMDETYKVAITRLGDRIRVGGTAEISGFDLRLHESRRRTLEHSVGDLFPGGGDLKAATFWCGLRPMTPDGPPLVGQSELSNLYLNTGHGTLGWTMACGSAKVLADIMSNRVPEINALDLSPDRYVKA
ncbi:D-amino acid dehydrogenase [Mesorhizobium sp.]|uniref:D-amino acid dehydrogenase n=1 Tax=Mesorhizobium sp. TaxID=1871066 RepID=UPI000FE3833F|nr:D-amino acid dehydrogenase [Mesorhizobium sp.]RWA70223.1 MAG: D-amino acid dehydrogenase [Mesorhizobium sp.]RWB99130.1 MAG: D-amino acid dehydrogenase [Mesorhizobium sp.]RWG80598.1 MAG: D-amino acid dehydrogenase [Mesorhizobium sp.]RWG86521.1 MAG: D-amino acid dehydrogenase [Mesorhizobium sp.]RWK04641.1 MAG: D-amino acid dehydrogenase [Mesorhizobium sp.]